MTHKQAMIDRFHIGLNAMGSREREAVLDAVRKAGKLPEDSYQMMMAIARIGAAKGREVLTRESDARSDARRRQLVGARLPREFVERVRACAAREQVSVYRYVREALEAACLRTENDT